jgi:hypothetical protein
VRELVNEGLLEDQLGMRRSQHLTQLLGVSGVEWGGSDHEGIVPRPKVSRHRQLPQLMRP